MGFSPDHATSAPLVLNLETGAITSQFHVVFDDWFATIATQEEDLPDFNEDEWSRMFGTSTYHEDPGDDEESEHEGELPPDNNDTRQIMEQEYHGPIAPPPAQLPLPKEEPAPVKTESALQRETTTAPAPPPTSSNSNSTTTPTQNSTTNTGHGALLITFWATLPIKSF